MANESKYADLLSSLGFILDKEPDEIRDFIRKVEELPDTPVYFILDDEAGGLPITIVLDETGAVWGKEGEVDLSKHGFEDYFAFKERVARNKIN